MSDENVEIVRIGYQRYLATGEFTDEIVTADFVWDMSNFHGWPEQQTYNGAEGARRFLKDWTDAWEEWQLEVDAIHDAGDRVVALLRQHGRSKANGMLVEMSFAQVWTVRGGKEARMDMYSDPAEAFEATGLSE